MPLYLCEAKPLAPLPVRGPTLCPFICMRAIPLPLYHVRPISLPLYPCKAAPLPLYPCKADPSPCTGGSLPALAEAPPAPPARPRLSLRAPARPLSPQRPGPAAGSGRSPRAPLRPRRHLRPSPAMRRARPALPIPLLLLLLSGALPGAAAPRDPVDGTGSQRGPAGPGRGGGVGEGAASLSGAGRGWGGADKLGVYIKIWGIR